MTQKKPNNSQQNATFIPRALGKNFLFFRKYYCPQHNTIEDASFHQETSAILNEMSFNRRGTKFALAAPRGSAKSSDSRLPGATGACSRGPRKPARVAAHPLTLRASVLRNVYIP